MSTYVGKNNYMAIVFLPKKRKCRLDEVDLAEEYDLELVSDQVLCCSRGREFFDGTYNG